MGLIAQLTEEIKNYPVTEVKVEIFDVTFPGGVLNVSEQGTFKVKVTNNGGLDLTDVTIRVQGQNGVVVANNGAAAPFVAEFISQVFPQIDAHGGSQISIGSFKFRAPANAQSSRVLLAASLEAWNTNFNHPLIDHTRPLAEAKGTFTAPVVQS
jgi:hypothetical protein